jgi:pimeloyl-ACP methyl ester carboxylesterase
LNPNAHNWFRWNVVALVITGIGGVIGLALAVRLLAPVSTEPFHDANGGAAAKSIAVVERWPINGDDQSVVIRARDLSDPALIWVGDLWCETPILRHFNAELENHFIVVYWCQRYSGQSLDAFAVPPKTLTLSQYVADLGVLVDGVRARFHQNKVVIIAHSSGTAVSLIYIQRHPENVAAYVGVGQIVNEAKSLERSFDFSLTQARARHNGQAAEELERIGPPPYGDDRSSTIVRKRAIAFGGAFHTRLSYSKLALLSAEADGNFKRPSGPRLPTTFVARNQPYVASKLRSRVAGLENWAT